MSIKAMNWAWGIELAPAVKIVLLKLADQANDDLECWPGQSSIAEHCSMSERTVMRHIQTLEATGVIFVERRKDESGRQEANLYRMNFGYQPGDKLSPGNEQKPGDNRVTTVSPGDGEPGDKSCKNRVTTVSPDKELKLFIEPKLEPKDARARKPRDELTLPDWLDPEDWQLYLDHRKAIKSKLTLQASRLAIAALDKLRLQGNPPRAVIEQSVLNGWTGLFPLRSAASSPGRSNAAMSEPELMRLGDELGIDPKPGESMRDYAARINEARQNIH